MIRLFTALSIPEPIADALLALETPMPGAFWQSQDQLHLTLRFIGEVDLRTAADIDDALSAIRAPGFTLELHGTGTFGGRDPRQLWAGVRPNAELMHLQRKVDTALHRLGVVSDGRRFTPHVTLARLKAPRREKLLEFLTAHALFASPLFSVSQFHLYESVRTSDGSHYRIERDYDLARI